MKLAQQLVAVAIILYLLLLLVGCTAKIDGGDLPQWEPRTPFNSGQVYEMSLLFPDDYP
jgi:hypothetical protein